MNLAFHLVFAACAIAAALTTREWYHRLLAPLFLLVFGAYVVALFQHLS